MMQDKTARLNPRYIRLLVVVVGAGVVAYAGSIRGPFIFDDLGSITDNPHIRRLWPLSNMLRAPAQEAVSGRPIVSLSLAINYALGGLDVRGYHAFNLTIHLLCSLLLFGIVRRTMQRPIFDDRFERSAPWVAAAVALIWTVHPLQTESVTYVIQRTELLMGFFYLLTLYCAIRGWGPSHRWLWSVAAVVSCTLGMGSKEVMASAPLMVLLYDRAFVSGSFGVSLRRRRGLYAGLAATWIVLGGLLIFGPRSGTVGFDLQINSLDYLRTQAQVIMWYLRLCVWPDPLVISYGWPAVRTWIDCMPQGLVLAALLAATLWALWRRHWLGFAGAWFFLILAPSSSFIPIVTELAAERRMYLPLAAVVALGVITGWRAMDYAFARFSLRRLFRRLIGGSVVAAVAGAMAYATAQRNKDYESAVAIWTDAVAKRPANARAQTNLGVALVNAERADEAIPHCRKALHLEPFNYLAINTLGGALAKKGKTQEAIEHYTAALELNADYYAAHLNLGNAMVTLGRSEEAFEHFNRALAQRPDYVDARVSLGHALAETGRVDEAIRHFRRALELKPQDVVCLNNLGDALAKKGNLSEAIQRYRAALQLSPDYHPAHNNLGNALVTLGRYPEAFEHFERALALRPDYADAHVSLGYALARSGQLDQAVGYYRRALKLEPDNVLCLNNLGNALLNQNEIEEAIATFRKALAINARRADTYNNLANALVTAGDPAGGVDCYVKAIALEPDLLPAHLNLAETYRRMERFEDAGRHYRQALALAERAGNTAVVQRIRQQIDSLE